MYKSIIWDLDGTLLDTLEDIAFAMNKTLLEFGKEIFPLERYQDLIGGGSRNMVTQLMETSCSENEAFSRYLDHYKDHFNSKTKPYPGINELLSKLHAASIKMFVITNKHHEQAVTLIRQHFPEIHFERICGLTDEVDKKPNPRVTLSVLSELGISPREALFVGDTPIDIATANAAGIDCAFIGWGYGTSENNHPQPDYTLSSVSELEKTIMYQRNWNEYL
jgi:phosphoglycolate phosphatase